ncbi:MAG: hypothetical protein HAW62_01435 [Endozoicomonadaceae bacterium]|nr:hypothetical protein [Endozoicomonadaceae bacterium]
MEMVSLIKQIHELKEKGFTLKAIKECLLD